ncbi:uncharacterized protein LOC127860978 [Dreissena polymorpha]|uniref:uncharacterized protein LOC127860978 n=1 Tax=Dreissena polymorpha TaxID=45954 RepID=UPI00226438D1|nr:uncharacterized protein LOC127860978 [Dreissena polymorpha]
MNSDKTVVCGFVVLAVILQNTVAVPMPGDEVENECGHIEIEEPDNLYIGRNVTITFRPQKIKNENPVLLNSNTKYFKHECLNGCKTSPFVFVLFECPDTLNNADFYVAYGCHSGYVRTRLKTLTDCGASYIRTCNPKIGQAEFVFIPTDAVKKFTDGYVLYWLETNPKTGFEFRVNISEHNYEQRNESNWAYVLVIHDVIRKNGYQYRVQCTDRPIKKGPVKHTDIITLDTRSPVSPVLGPLVNIDDCTGCLHVNTSRNTYKDIFCTSHGATNTRVTLKINGYTYRTENDANGTYRTIFTSSFDENDHLKQVVCSAATCGQLNTSATLYVAVQSDGPKLNIPVSVLYKGVQPNITCSSKGGRPKSVLTFYLNGNEISSTQIDQYDNTKRTYNSVATVTDVPDKNWDGAEIRCSQIQIHNVSSKHTRPIKVTYTYPPSDITIVVDNSNLIRTSGKDYPVEVACKSSETNAKCNMSLTTSSNRPIYLKSPRKTSENPLIIYNATINGSLGERDVTITCSLYCDHFEKVIASTIINLPHPPKIQINTSSPLIIEEGSTQQTTCLADSYPPSNITWSYTQDGREETSSCNGATLCSVLVSGLRDGEKREYMCSVVHMLLASNKSFVAEGRARKSEITQDEQGGSMALVGGLVGSCVLLAGVAAMIKVCYWKRRQHKRRTHRNDTVQRSHEIHVSGTNDDQLVEYAVVSKTSKSTVSEHVNASVQKSIVSKANTNIPSAHVGRAGPKTVVSTNTLTVSTADEYAVVSKTCPNPAIVRARGKAPPKTDASGDQLVYVELDRDVLETRPSAARPVQEEAVEYVGIDFSKTATIEKDDNIYTNK